MFNGANIEELDITNFDTSNVTSMGSMFKDTTKLKTIYV
jgi:surface protein